MKTQNSLNNEIGNTQYATTSPGSAYLECNGQIVNQASYAALYAKVGNLPSFDTSVATNMPGALTDVAYSSALGLYVGIVGSATYPNIYVSTDLKNWNGLTNTGTPFALSSIAWASTIGKFVIAGGTYNVFTSSDGYNWDVSQVYADASGAAISCVGASPTLMVAAGASDNDNSITNLYTSADGLTWTRRQFSSAADAVTYIHWSVAQSQWVIGCANGKIFTSPDAITWTARTSNIAASIAQIDSSAGVIVAVGGGGAITVSTDSGATWTAKTKQTVANLTGVAYNASATTPWIATGNSVIMSSADGITWNALLHTIGGRKNIFYGNGIYVQTGISQYVATSTDLINWTSRTPGAGLAAAAMNAGAYGNSAYVMVGNSGKIDSSADAITWTNRTANAGTNNLVDVIYAGGTINLFIAVGAGNTIVTSPDGTTWTARTSNIVSSIASVAWDSTNNRVVAVGTGGKITYSTDGINWASQTSNTTLQLTSVAWNGTIWCAVGANGVVLTSSNGTAWTKQRPTSFGSGFANTLTTDGTAFYTNINATIFRSTDGITWVGYAAPIIFNELNYTNGQFIGQGGSCDTYISSDAKTWSMPSFRGQVSLFRTYTFGSAFVTVFSGGVLTSTTGTAFNAFTTSILSAAAADSAGNMVLVGSLGNLFTSTDGGVTLTPRYFFNAGSSTTMTFTDVAYSPSLDMFVAVATSGMIITSTDKGVTWTQQITSSIHFSDSPAGTLQSICWSPDLSLFVAVGNAGVILTSANGTTWTERVSGTITNLNQVCWNASLGKFLALGAGGVGIISANGTSWTPVVMGTKIAIQGVASLEAKGFVAGDVSGGTYVSANGSTGWKQTSGNIMTNGIYGKLFYSAADEAAFFGTSSSNVENPIVFTKDGVNLTDVWVGNGLSNLHGKGCYDSNHDSYFFPGIVNVRLTRRYDPATQFALPTLENTWIKVL